jgi:hypothetical protein
MFHSFQSNLSKNIQPILSQNPTNKGNDKRKEKGKREGIKEE